MENILGAISTIVEALDPERWLPADFEKTNQGFYLISNYLSHCLSSF